MDPIVLIKVQGDPVEFQLSGLCFSGFNLAPNCPSGNPVFRFHGNWCPRLRKSCRFCPFFENGSKIGLFEPAIERAFFGLLRSGCAKVCSRDKNGRYSKTPRPVSIQKGPGPGVRQKGGSGPGCQPWKGLLQLPRSGSTGNIFLPFAG